MYLITAEKKVGYIGRLTRSEENFLYIFKVENETEIKRFNEKNCCLFGF